MSEPMNGVETDMDSPLLQTAGAVAASGADAQVAAHYGSFNAEQRTLVSGDGFVDHSHRDVIEVSGPDRLTWLDSLTTQALTGLQPANWVELLSLNPQGHIEHHLTGVDDGERFLAHVEPGTGAALIEYLDRMRFMMQVEVRDATADKAAMWRPGEGNGRWDLIDRDRIGDYAAAVGPPAGIWAYDALRIARGQPRVGVDTDQRTIPNELGWVAEAPAGTPAPTPVHLDKGCYRGQETVARIHTLGRPPRRLTLLHLDGSTNALPVAGTPIEYQGRQVGFIGSSARHWEVGPIALGLVKRSVPLEAPLGLGEETVTQEMVVDPEVGLHVRPRI